MKKEQAKAPAHKKEEPKIEPKKEEIAPASEHPAVKPAVFAQLTGFESSASTGIQKVEEDQ